ncbi:MAG: hypothetical protein ACPGU5_07875 [Lishizhenia sp.]
MKSLNILFTAVCLISITFNGYSQIGNLKLEKKNQEESVEKINKGLKKESESLQKDAEILIEEKQAEFKEVEQTINSVKKEAEVQLNETVNDKVKELNNAKEKIEQKPFIDEPITDVNPVENTTKAAEKSIEGVKEKKAKKILELNTAIDSNKKKMSDAKMRISKAEASLEETKSSISKEVYEEKKAKIENAKNALNTLTQKIKIAEELEITK